MARLVRFRVLDGIAVITLEAPPVNALSAPLRAGMWEALTRINDNPDIKAGILMATGTMFSAGADIREFNQAPAQPSLPQLCDKIESCSKSMIAAAHGQALGGGAELMLAAHYRLGTPQARIGFGEVSLGLIPGAGGTQRLPRLIGAERALTMMVSGRAIDAATAQAIGLLDGIVQGDMGSGAIAFARNLIETGKGVRPTRQDRRFMKDGRAYQASITKARATLGDNPQYAPHRIVDCVEAASLLPFDTGLAFEADAFSRCMAHPQSTALRHVFFAERRIDSALIERVGDAFKPVDPMGKSTVRRLRHVMKAAADILQDQGHDPDRIDEAMVAYGFRKGPFGGNDAGEESADIVVPLLAAMVAEGAACVEEQAVQRPSDIDALAVHGLGFPRRKGGPMRAVQSMGLIALRNQMRDWAEISDIWAVPDLIDQAIKDAKGFDAFG